MGPGGTSTSSKAVGGRGRRDLCADKHHTGDTHLKGSRDAGTAHDSVHITVRAREGVRQLHISLKPILAVCHGPVLPCPPSFLAFLACRSWCRHNNCSVHATPALEVQHTPLCQGGAQLLLPGERQWLTL